MQNRKGFTLIELLVVIAIIGILSAVGLIALNGAREKARDSQRKSDVGQLRTGLALYYDTNNNYPGSDTGVANGHTTDATEGSNPTLPTTGGVLTTTVKWVRTDSAGSVAGDLLFDALVSGQKYISRLPAAPTSGASTSMQQYWYASCAGAGSGAVGNGAFAIASELERPATTGTMWIVNSTNGTASEVTAAATYCS